ncbi:hypothetical protein [Streptomyces beigongshangae]|uniref:hypothetical protein n=1 Tax=Streptomyces beigongshangae TaxID=2841597 RepID=UPI001C85BB3A|nr:hypothetical protein [Streptomyces sp. REN17]
MGRPLGDLKGLTEQADEFARWLRKITYGVTVRTLEKEFPHGKTSWSRFRDGSRLPPALLVEEVTTRFCREPMMRKRQLEHGLSLLAAAERAAKDLSGQAAPSATDLPATRAPQQHSDIAALALRLDDARMLQFEAMRKYEDTARQCEELKTMVEVLEQRITILESERDRARENVRAELQHELQMSREYRRQAGERLKKAGRALERAQQLRLVANKQVVREQHELFRANGGAMEEPPPVRPGMTVAEELQLPPLERFQEFFDVNQQQMDALDDELDDLGRELGVQQDQDLPEDSTTHHVIWGQTAEPAGAEEDVPGQTTDNARKPLTSADKARPAKEIGPEVSPADAYTAAASPRHAMSTQWVANLRTASTPEALATALSQLRRRTGTQPIRELAATLPDDMRDDVLSSAVGRWIDGDALPDTWTHLEALIRQMGASDDEALAFEQAYRRIASSTPPWSARDHDLADLAPFPRSMRHLLGASGTLPRKREWGIAAVAPAAVLGMATAYTAALQTSPRPGPVTLSVYGALLLTGCLFILIATARVAILCSRGRHSPLSKRFSATCLAASALAAPAGLALPWFLNFDFPGRWLAHLMGLL